jgi:predicted transcriptional regulator
VGGGVVTWNGNQDRVLNAIRQGVTDRHAIGPWLGIDQGAVDNALRRLRDQRHIRATRPGHYEATSAPCLLEQVWR